jgi:hypothetical protein
MAGNYPEGVTDNDPYFDLPNAHEDEDVCRNCDGSGIAGYATREMALDAGDTQLEGQPVTCPFCKGE